MKKYKIKVQYSFDADFVINAENEEGAKKLITTKVKAMSGSINTFSIQIRDWAMGSRPTETKIIKVTEV